MSHDARESSSRRTRAVANRENSDADGQNKILQPDISQRRLEADHECSRRPKVSGVGAGASDDIAVGNR